MTPEQRAEYNRRRRLRYATDPVHRESTKKKARKRRLKHAETINQNRRHQYATDPDTRQKRIDSAVDAKRKRRNHV